MVAITALKNGDKVWSVTRQKMGNTTMMRTAVHSVVIHEVHDDHVIASWNGNPAKKFYPREITRWKRNKPKES